MNQLIKIDFLLTQTYLIYLRFEQNILKFILLSNQLRRWCLFEFSMRMKNVSFFRIERSSNNKDEKKNSWHAETNFLISLSCRYSKCSITLCWAFLQSMLMINKTIISSCKIGRCHSFRLHPFHFFYWQWFGPLRQISSRKMFFR